MHSDFTEPIWLKLGMAIDTIELYILILACLTLTLNQGHRDAREQNKQTNKQTNKNWCANHLTKFWTDLNEIWSAVEFRWSDDPHSHLTMSDQC